jgi:deoxyadenosine/deoxycytidine kinase
MGERDYETYRSLYKAIASFLPPPDLVIYLKASTPTLLAHISKRGRDFEQNIDPAYVEQLNTLYNDWIDDWTACPVFTVDLDNCDFIANTSDLTHIFSGVREHLPR